MMLPEWIEYCTQRHDVDVNQKYNGNLPYSFHLGCVAANVNRFKDLLPYNEYVLASFGAWGHDLIEDARLTYNDVAELTNEEVAEIIYACTELKGKNRTERHGPEFWNVVRESKVGTFVKLCDILANLSFSLLTNSSMYKKYGKEWEHTSAELAEYREVFAPLFNEIEYMLRYERIAVS